MIENINYDIKIYEIIIKSLFNKIYIWYKFYTQGENHQKLKCKHFLKIFNESKPEELSYEF